MQGYCVIDNYLTRDGHIILGGWAYFESNKKRLPAQKILIADNAPVKFEFHSRADLSSEPNSFGFRLHFEGYAEILALLTGLTTCAAVLDGFKVQATLWKKIYGKIYIDAVCHGVEKLEEDVKDTLVSRAVRLIPDREAPLKTEVQSISVETGFAPYDKSVVLGKNGYAFLFSGSNSLHKQYLTEANPRLVEDWKRLIIKRHELCQSLGARFLQIIVPEKQSVLSSYYPYKIETPTKALEAINSQLDNLECYLNLHNVFKLFFNDTGLSPFRKMDSHLSFHGAQLSAIEIFARLTGDRPVISEPRLHEVMIDGDLGTKFGWGNVMENATMPSEKDWDFANLNPALIDKFDPPDGNTGSFRYWENSASQFNTTVLIFGNSIFERGIRPFGLSWWLSRLFRKTYFVWSPELDVEQIKKLSPNHVISQTVERFLPTLPKA